MGTADTVRLEYQFGAGRLGLRFSEAAEGLPVRVKEVIPGSQADGKGLSVGVPLCAVNGVEVAESGHADVIAMVRAAAAGAGAGVVSARGSGGGASLTFLTPRTLPPLPQTPPVDNPTPKPSPRIPEVPPAWLLGLGGEWVATGTLQNSDGEETERILVEVSRRGELSGFVDDGDGDFDEDDCKIGNGRCVYL